MSKIIVTGATSFIGAPLVKKLVENGHVVYAVIRPKSKNINTIIKDDRVRIVECDMNDYDMLPNLIDSTCDAFYHIAWDGTRVPERDDYDIQTKNYINSIKAFNSSLKLGCSQFYSVGSQAEYGTCVGKIDEDYPTLPKTEYGKAKLRTCTELSKMALASNIKFGWIRLFSAYGMNDYDNSLISFCLKKMINNEDVELTAGIQNWNYVFIDDVINVLYQLFVCETFKNEVFNVCSNDNRILKEYVIEIKDILNSSSKLLFGAKKYNDSEGIVSFIPSNKKVKEFLHYDEYVSFSDGIYKIIKSMVISR